MQLEIRNFRSISYLNLLFENGTTLLTGNSGCGKTTIAQAVEWCLYGKLTHVSRLNEKPTVTLTLNNGTDGTVVIKRTETKNRLDVTIDGNICSVPDEYVQKIFGSLDNFKAACILEQKLVNPLLVESAGMGDVVNSYIFPDREELPDTILEKIVADSKELATRRSELDGAIATEKAKLAKYPLPPGVEEMTPANFADLIVEFANVCSKIGVAAIPEVIVDRKSSEKYSTLMPKSLAADLSVAIKSIVGLSEKYSKVENAIEFRTKDIETTRGKINLSVSPEMLAKLKKTRDALVSDAKTYEVYKEYMRLVALKTTAEHKCTEMRHRVGAEENLDVGHLSEQRATMSKYIESLKNLGLGSSDNVVDLISRVEEYDARLAEFNVEEARLASEHRMALDKYDHARKEYFDRRNIAEAERSRRQAEADELWRKSMTAASDAKAKYIEAKARYDGYQASIAKIEDEFAKLSTEDAEWQAIVERRAVELRNIESAPVEEVSGIDGSAACVTYNCPHCSEKIYYNASSRTLAKSGMTSDEIAEIKAKVAARAAYVQRLENARSGLADAKARVIRISERITELENKFAALTENGEVEMPTVPTIKAMSTPPKIELEFSEECPTMPIAPANKLVKPKCPITNAQRELLMRFEPHPEWTAEAVANLSTKILMLRQYEEARTKLTSASDTVAKFESSHSGLWQEWSSGVMTEAEVSAEEITKIEREISTLERTLNSNANWQNHLAEQEVELVRLRAEIPDGISASGLTDLVRRVKNAEDLIFNSDSRKHYKKKIARIESEIVSVVNTLDQYAAIKSKFFEKKSQYIARFIQNLEKNINIFLQELFEKSIEFQFTNLPVRSTTKPEKLGYLIHYNGRRDLKDVKTLSGGEKDRFSIALTLAFALTKQVPFIFLDETMSSLDPDTRVKCCDLINRYCSHIPVMLISHDILSGEFGNILNVQDMLEAATASEPAMVPKKTRRIATSSKDTSSMGV